MKIHASSNKKIMYKRKVTYAYDIHMNIEAWNTFFSVAWKTLSPLSMFTVVLIMVKVAITVF